jgi:hypothetical protein
MKGVSVSRDPYGNVVTVTAIDIFGHPCIYSRAQYEERGYEPDWRTLPDENEIKQ